MSLLTNKLSELQPGSHVRFTHTSGQIIEGIVAENDREESLSIRVTSVITLLYDKISMLVECEQDALSLPSAKVINEPKHDCEVMKPPCGKEDVSQVFKAMDQNEKKALNSAYGKLNSYYQSHDTGKCKEVISAMQTIIDDNSWDNNPRVNLLLGLVQLSCGDFSAAAESFFRANDTRYAYCAVYQGAESTDNTKLYQLAAKFAVIYLLGLNIDNADEAVTVLQRSSAAAKDISGLEYARLYCGDDVADKVQSAIRSLAKTYVGSEGESADIGSLLMKIKAYCPNTDIGEKIAEYFGKTDEQTKPSSHEEKTAAKIDTASEYKGNIIPYDFTGETWKVEMENGQKYRFDIIDVEDVSLRTKLNDNKEKPEIFPIAVKFTLKHKGKRFFAVSLKEAREPAKSPDTAVDTTAEKETIKKAESPVKSMGTVGKLTEADYTISMANSLYTYKNFLDSLTICEKLLEGDNIEDRENAFALGILCHLALNNKGENLGYLNKLNTFVEKHIDTVRRNTKVLESLQQYYSKVQDYPKAISALNDLVELCDPLSYEKFLFYYMRKYTCYKAMGDYRSAIGELRAWLDLVNTRRITDYYKIRDNSTYISLAELYFEKGDYDNAKKYAELSSSALVATAQRKQDLLQKIDGRKASSTPSKSPDIDDDNYEDEEGITGDITSEPEESLQTAYESYTDKDGFDALNTDDLAVITKAFSFNSRQLHCLLTYLHSAAILSSDSQKTRVTDSGETVYIGQAISVVNSAVSYAFRSPLADMEYFNAQITTTFNEVQKYIPTVAPSMFAASALYALFSTPSTADYNINNFYTTVESYNLEQYTTLLPLLNDLISFRNNPGYGMDSFAAYKTGIDVLDAIINEAKKCCEAVDMRNDIYESQGQLRRTRKYMFSDDSSELRACLNIVAANETSKFQYVKDTISNLFIRKGRSISVDNIDVDKLGDYIDGYWERARDAILNENKHVERPHDNLKGGKRSNVTNTIRRILHCICDWIAAVEHTSGTENTYALSCYNQLAPKVISELTNIVTSCENIIETEGFDWGTESLRLAASQLLAKMDGTYSGKERRYLFVDFLRGEDILLNDSYLPEVQSSFCNMPDFNILQRIEHHASTSHPELSDRLTEIFSDKESKHNLRTAKLIRDFGEDMGIPNITNHKDISLYNECLKQAKRRFDTILQDFSAELELYENYGTLSNINGEKDKIMAVAQPWYRITKITSDYGFYVRLLEVIRGSISANAEKKGEQLMRKLNELADNPDYTFGVFTKEMIAAKINDQNYSSAEYIMGRILAKDVNSISDYSTEPFGYFEEFISEYATNSRAVRGTDRDLKNAIFDYSGRRDLEKALATLTNNTHKETKGGANLLKNWIPRSNRTNTDQLTKFLICLGFRPKTVQTDRSVDAETEAYHVLCQQQIGKVNYVHHIPAFGSKSESEGFRVLCLRSTFNCEALMDKFRSVNTAAKSTLVLLDFAMNLEERRRLARKIKEEKSFAKTFIVIDRIVLFYLAKHYAENTIIKRLMAVTLPFAYYQPFVEASMQDMPPELFTGRESELLSIESADGASLVYGGRQLGKSALLKMAKRDIDKNGNGDRAVFLDVKDRTAEETAKIVCDRLIIEGILDEQCRCDTWVSLAGCLQRRLADDNPQTRVNYLLLMLDEADVFIKTSGETVDQPITALKSLPSDRFKLVMAGLHNLSRYSREMTHGNSNLIHLKSVVVKQFRREEATKLLTSILAYLGFRFNQDIIDSILASTYNYPGLIQFYCQKLLETMKNEDYAGYNENMTPPYEVTESHYKRVLSDTEFTEKVNEKLEATLFTEEKGRSNYHIIALILAYLYYTEPSEKGYTRDDLLRVANEYRINRVTGLSPEQLAEILSEMWDLNVITDMGGYYSFAADGFRKLLGSKEKVEESMGNYFEEAVAI